MLSYVEALASLQQAACRLPTETVSLSADCQALEGRFLAESVVAQVDVPAFHNSAMDGFAMRATDTEGASVDQPVTLAVTRCLAAGDAALLAPPSGAVEIMTGAAVPAGMDAVVPIEKVVCQRDAQGDVTAITLHAPLRVGENIRYRGEDFQVGMPIASAGQRLDAACLAAMAATGVHELKLVRSPKIGLLATGKEVSDDYTQALAASTIYNSNVPYLSALFAEAGYDCAYVGNIGDDAELLSRWIDEQTEQDLLISTGAVSMGKWDFIPEVLQAKGARILFHGVGIKPGKPILFAQLPDGRYFFGLPGNPVSAAVGVRFFVQPLLRAMMGLAPEAPLRLPLLAAHSKKGALRHFLKSRLQFNEAGLKVEVLAGQESFKISPLLHMNGWAVMAEADEKLAAGDRLDWWSMSLFPHWQG